ncbi:Ig-like domain-containing protein, partial [Salmonella enterica]|nr:Ig-like domain-containing protein [Salmonella enterica]EKR4010847.1 Ig-like domain-containing protein [Salmonella enterica]ELG0397463.1 Ig-like domain-containing protein [Salmonella enterica]
ACGGTDEAKLSTVTATTDSAGHSTATVASISPYHVCSGLKLSAAVGTAGHKTTTLNYIAEEASANVKTVALPGGAKTTYTADGKDTATWNATVADQYGNAVSGETVTWGGVTGAQPKYAAATTTTDAAGHTSNTMTSTTAATNVKATATVSSTTHTGTPVTATTPVTFTADASKATLTVTVTGSRQPTETDTSHTAATADGADLLTLHFKAVDGNGNPVTSTPVHYTTAVTDAGIVKDTLACTTNTNGECTSTVKTTKAGTYNVWVALVPAGAAQPVSPVKTALVFLAGPPDATNTTVSTDRSAANADNKETITVTLTPRDSHNNVVPLWTFRKDLTIVPSVNATVPGAVTVTTPAQDAAGNVAATLTYVDTSGKLLSKEARAGTTTITIGKAVKQTVDTRFYPQVHVCVSNLSASGFIVPGQTEVQICDGSGHAVPNGSGYTVTLPGMSSAGCTKSGGGVCPPDTAGVKADFTGLTGDDIAQLVFRPTKYDITDTIANVTFKSGGPGGVLAYYAELASHFPSAPLGGNYGSDIFHTADAKAFCSNAPGDIPRYPKATFSEGVYAGIATGGAASVSGVKSLFIGRIADAIKTGGDTNPELFVSGGGNAAYSPKSGLQYTSEVDHNGHHGALFPRMLVMVNGPRSSANAWSFIDDGPDAVTFPGVGTEYDVAIGWKVADVTHWNLSDMYFVNNWPGTPLTQHKADRNDTTNKYVTQVNYVSGYVCNASLQ